MEVKIIKDMVENPHEIYVDNAAYWNFLLQSHEGGLAYTNAMITGRTPQQEASILGSLFRYFVNGKQQASAIAGNLFMHPKEKTEDYNRRVNMSYYYNFCAPIIDIYSDHLFKQAVVEDFKEIEETIEETRNNIDRQGSSIQEFRKEMADLAQIHGHCFAIVDSPLISGTDIITRQDQINLGAFPYVTLFAPQNVINWALDGYGMPYWVLVREIYDGNENPAEFDKSAKYRCYYRLWTRDTWSLYSDKYELMAQDVHNLGRVPIVPVYAKKSKTRKNFLGVSDLADISFIARDIYNSSSELRQILRDQTFAFLAVQGTADEYKELSIGTSKGLLYPEGRNKPEYVSPPADNAEVYFNHIDRQIAKIYQLAKLDSGGVSGKVNNPGEGIVDPQSGASKAWDFNQTNSALSSKSSNLEDAEMSIWELYALWEGKDFTGNVQYANEFSVSSFMDDLKEAKECAELSLGISFNLEIRKALIKKKFPRMPDAEIAKMEKEVEDLMKKEMTGPKPSSMIDRVNALLKNTATGGQKQGVVK